MPCAARWVRCLTPGGQFALVLCACGLLSTLLAVAALGVPWVRGIEREVPEVVGTPEA